MELTEKERQAIYDVIAYEERKHDIFDPKHVERIARTIQEKLAKLRKNEAPSESTTASDISNYLCDKYSLTIDYAPILEEAYELGQIRANSSKICKVNKELLEALALCKPYIDDLQLENYKDSSCGIFEDKNLTHIHGKLNNAIQNAKNQNQ